MSEIIHEGGNAVGKKLGPLPVWAYAAIIAVVAWGWFYWKNHSVGRVNPAAQSAVPPVDAGTIAGASGALPSTYSGIVQTTPGTPSLSTNAQWAKYAADQLNALGYAPDAVANALSAYVNGTKLDAQGQSLISIALQKFGTPPQGVLPVPTTPAAPSYGAGYRYTVQAGDTLDSIMQRFYGTGANPITARIITDQNPGVVNWNGTGWTLPGAGSQIYLGPNGIVNTQANTLNTYDTGHTIDPTLAPTGYKVV